MLVKLIPNIIKAFHATWCCDVALVAGRDRERRKWAGKRRKPARPGGQVSAQGLVWGDCCQGCCKGHLLVRLACDISSSRPDFRGALRAAAVKGGRRPSRSDLPLTAASTASDLLSRDDTGVVSPFVQIDNGDDTEGSSPSGALRAPRTCIRPTREDRNHDAVMRIGGEAPRRRAHSKPRREGHSPTSGCRCLGPSSAAERQCDARLQQLNLETAVDAELIEIVEMRPTAPHSLNLAETLYKSRSYLHIGSSNCCF